MYLHWICLKDSGPSHLVISVPSIPHSYNGKIQLIKTIRCVPSFFHILSLLCEEYHWPDDSKISTSNHDWMHIF
jgi:hypothetical protein